MRPLALHIKNILLIRIKLASVIHLALLCVFLCSACKKQPITQNNQVLSMQETDLIGEWVHSHEEDSIGLNAYRKKPYDFPPSRGRKSFILKAEHQLQYYDLSPTCGLSGFKGTWSYRQGQLTLVFNDQILCYKITRNTSIYTKLYLNKCF